MICGWVVNVLRSAHGWGETRSYRVVFFAYAALGLVKLLFTLSLSPKVEAATKKPEPVREAEQAPLLGEERENGTGKKNQKPSLRTLLPQLSPESAVILFKLALLFSLDSFASGLAPLYGYPVSAELGR